MGSVVHLREPDDIGRLKEKINEAKESSVTRRTVDNGGGPPHNGDMENRVAKLEQSVEQIRGKLDSVATDVAVVKSNYATKADVAEAKNSIIMWVVSAILLAQVLPMILKKLGM